MATTQPVFVAETEKEAEKLYSEAVAYFYDKCRHIYPGFANIPGYQTLRGVRETMDRERTIDNIHSLPRR